MNERQMADRIGNIDDRLIQQAQNLPNYKKQHRIKGIKRVLAGVAALVLMAGSFTMGMVVQARQLQPAEQGTPLEAQMVELEDFNLSLILPERWKGLYGVERTAPDCYTFYSTETRGADKDGGNLFYIARWGEPLTEEQVKAGGEWDVVGNEYIMATKNETYLLYYVSDVQYTPETEEIYFQMLSEISQIRFVTGSTVSEK